MHYRVLTASKSSGISSGLIYESSQKLAEGTGVSVPLRNQNIEGIVLFEEKNDAGIDVKEISSVLHTAPLLHPAHIHTMQWISQYYKASIRQVIRVFLPPPPWKTLLPEKIEGYTLHDSLFEPRGKKQQEVIDVLVDRSWVSWDEIREQTGAPKSTVTSLVTAGVVQKVFQEESFDDDEVPITSIRPSLNEDQQNAYACIADSKNPSLLFGVTGSGKTEVYLQLIADCIAQGKQAIVLVPEIFLTEHSIQRYTALFPKEHIAVLHSKLTPAVRRKEWKRIRYGDVRLIIGSRSALFAPVVHLGLIVIDEEHEWTYKNEQIPRYHTRETAEILCQNFNAKLVLGSATPSIESWKKTGEGQYTLVRLPNRYNNASLPHVTVVDLAEVDFGSLYPFSNTLLQAIDVRLQKHEQSVLFLNRRGFATALLCLECRRRVVSPESNLPFTVHRTASNKPYLQDHTTGATAAVPETCPGCGSTRLHLIGAGTQKVEQILRQVFPTARILRADSDTLSSPEAMRTVLEQMEKNKADILLGTQSIVKGLDLPHVTLSAVVLADVGLSLPHFRAGERVFQLLTQLTGRSGRHKDRSGEVIIQTYRPDAPEVQFAANHDTELYLNTELALRKSMGYPPYSELVRLILRGEDVANRAKKTTALLRKNADPSLHIGCSPTLFGGGKEWHIFLRGSNPISILRKIDLQGIVVDRDPLQCI